MDLSALTTPLAMLFNTLVSFGLGWLVYRSGAKRNAVDGTKALVKMVHTINTELRAQIADTKAEIAAVRAELAIVTAERDGLRQKVAILEAKVAGLLSRRGGRRPHEVAHS